MPQHFEFDHLSNMLDDSFLEARGGGMGGGRMGGGGGRPAPRPSAPRAPAPAPRPSAPPAPRAPAPAPRPSARPARSSTTRHRNMVRRFYRNYNRRPYYYRNRGYVISPYWFNWWGGGAVDLYGYPFEFWYPMFAAITSADVNEQAAIRAKYNISDEDWDMLMDRLVSDNYVTYVNPANR